jgi:hypothetical protein
MNCSGPLRARRRRTSAALRAILIALCCCASNGLAGEIVHRDGRIVHGQIEFSTNGLTVSSSGGTPETVAFADVRRASFESNRSELASNSWQSADVGEVHLPGTFRSTNDTLIVRGSGWGCWPSEDGFRLACKPLRGDGQIVARVQGFDDSNGIVFAGVSLRESLAASSPHVTVLASSAQKLQMRARTGGETEFFVTEETKATQWLRVARRGNVLTAYQSPDGTDWRLIEQKEVVMKPDALAGIVVATRVNSALGGATFGAVAVTTGQPGNGLSELPARGVVLRDGSVLAGRVTSDDGRILHVTGGVLGEHSLSAHRVAAVLFRPAPASLGQASVQPARHGLWLLSGDVMEGDLVSLGTNRVAIASVLLGLKSYNLAANPVAYVFDRVSGSAPPWMVKLRDGSRLSGSSLAVGDGTLTVEHPFLGKISVPQSQVTELVGGAGPPH